MYDKIIKRKLKEGLVSLYESGLETTFLYGNLQRLNIVELPRSNLPEKNVNVFNLKNVYENIVDKNKAFLDGMHGIDLNGNVVFWSAKIYTTPLDKDYPKNIGTREATLLELIEQSPEVELFDVNHVGVVKYSKNVKSTFSKKDLEFFDGFATFIERIHPKTSFGRVTSS